MFRFNSDKRIGAVFWRKQIRKSKIISVWKKVPKENIYKKITNFVRNFKNRHSAWRSFSRMSDKWIPKEALSSRHPNRLTDKKIPKKNKY